MLSKYGGEITTANISAPHMGLEVPITLGRRSEAQLHVDCSSCIGACCLRGMTTTLTAVEAELLAKAGTGLEKLDQEIPRSVKRRYLGHERKDLAVYQRTTDCGYLVKDVNGQTSCGVHDDSELFPVDCREFPVGSEQCRELRVAADIDPPEKLQLYQAVNYS